MAPLWWLLFSAGGVVSALLMPVSIVLTGIAVPAGWLSEDSLLELARHPLGGLYVFVLVSMSLFHWAHRFRYALVDLGLVLLGRQSWLFYGAAIGGTLLSGWLILRL
ncbi:MAG: fumarate reductase subunit FrdD [Acidimicrobiia bacterium]